MDFLLAIAICIQMVCGIVIGVYFLTEGTLWIVENIWPKSESAYGDDVDHGQV